MKTAEQIVKDFFNLPKTEYLENGRELIALVQTAINEYESNLVEAPVSDDFGVKISDVLGINAWRKKFNSIPLEKLKLINDDGTYFKLDPNIIEDFKYTGLDNFDFVRTDFYKNGFTG